MRLGLTYLMGLLVGGLLTLPGHAGAVTFTFTTIGGDTLTEAQSAAFGAAAAAWSAALTDPVQVQVGIGFRDLGTVGGATILGSTRPSFQVNAYGALRAGLTTDVTGRTDVAAVAHLPGSVPSSQVLLTTAQARAVGLTASTADGSIESTSHDGVSYAATRAEVTAGSYDLIGVAEHEIGHLLGFESALDFGTSIRSVLDLFRYSMATQQSFAPGEAAYFSVDGGVTSLGGFSVGGDAQYQASHWLQGTGALLEPAIAAGMQTDITPRDLAALDAIGWDVAVAEPASWIVMLAGLGGLGVRVGRRQWSDLQR